MPSNPAWKQLERRVSQLFCTERTPCSGSNSKHTASDTLSKTFFIEAKLRASSYANKLLRQTRKQADKESKIPVVAIQEKNHVGFLVAVHSTDLEDFCRAYLSTIEKPTRLVTYYSLEHCQDISHNTSTPRKKSKKRH